MSAWQFTSFHLRSHSTHPGLTGLGCSLGLCFQSRLASNGQRSPEFCLGLKPDTRYTVCKKVWNLQTVFLQVCTTQNKKKQSLVLIILSSKLTHLVGFLQHKEASSITYLSFLCILEQTKSKCPITTLDLIDKIGMCLGYSLLLYFRRVSEPHWINVWINVWTVHLYKFLFLQNWSWYYCTIY